MENSWVLLLALAFALSLLSKIISKNKPQTNSPPGPKPWPIIGSLHLVAFNPRQSVQHLSKKYGEIMLLVVGKFPVLIISSPEMAKHFLTTNDAVFASRPAFAAGKHTGYGCKNTVWAPYGPYWIQARKIYHSEVLNEKRLQFFESIRVQERRDFISRLYSLSGKPIVLRDHLSSYALSNICRMVTSNEYFIESKHDKSIMKLDELEGMLDELISINAVFNIGDWIPWLSFLDLQGYVKKMKVLNKKLDRFYNYVIDDHESRRAVEKDNFKSKDLVDVLLQQAEDPKLEVKLTRDHIKGLIQDLLVGGTGTITKAIEWAIREILKNPRVAEKAKAELDRIIGRKRWVEEKDLSQLHYIDAIIMESLRLHPLTTFITPHYSTKDCKVAGYYIGKGTSILIDVWSIGRDPKSWDAPEEFLPERFLGKEIDMLGNNCVFLPFGWGRRRCPGYNLGLKIVRTTLANLLHGFDIKLAESMRLEDVCMHEMDEFIVRPKVPLTVVMDIALPHHLY
ncbi:hypothetical protein C2S51_033780 [Perilla frutescens var. frutescens]|nr:hypothetical protein C2S51_033780 [Perilla frutescens var. frutescens]